ncbi:hypothetical protein [Mucisphaera sp.]|uniref:hypothetical protein n=1 Tax=Mucisphaera sp. TaxID=2913024 RepID=UPI003D0BA574
MFNRLMMSAFIGFCTAHAALAGPVLTPNGSVAGINTGFGDVIGQGATLNVNVDATGLVSMTLNRGAGGLFDAAVIYFDSIGGGFTSTSGMNDTGDPGRRAISGTNAAGSADLTFAPGFSADFAVTFETAFSGLFSLDSSSHGFVAAVSTDGTRDALDSSFSIAFHLSDIGLTLGESFDFVMTYLNPNPDDGGGAFRSNEFIGVASGSFSAGNIGTNSASLATDDFVTVQTSRPEIIPTPAAFVAGLLGMATLLGRRSR